MASSDWSELSFDLLLLIFDKLSISDCIRFSAVCTNWNIFFNIFKQEDRSSPRTTPWLMLQKSTTSVQQIANCFSIADEKCYNIPLRVFPSRSEIPLAFCFGCLNGWLITADEKYKVHLVHPIDGIDISLPSLTTIDSTYANIQDDDGGIRSSAQYVCRRERVWRSCPFELQKYFQKAAMSSTLRMDEVIVMMIHDVNRMLSFTRVGDTTWKLLKGSKEDAYKTVDVIFHDGKFYTLSCEGIIEVWEPDGLSFKPRVVAPKVPTSKELKILDFENDNPEFFEDIDRSYFFLMNYPLVYLVESADKKQLMLVFIEQQDIPEYDLDDDSKVDLKVATIKILTWDENKLKWMHIKSLGNQVLFLDRHQSICKHASMVPDLQPNCIYFTHQFDFGIFHLQDTGVFHMENNDIKSFNLPDDEHVKTLSNIWFTPSFNSYVVS